MSLLEQFQKNWKANFADLLPENKKVLLAISGGLDSCVLLDLFHQSGVAVELAHCNFNLRGNESDEDELFVKSLAELYKTPLHIQHFDTKKIASENKIGIEEAARKLRYHWFLELLKNNCHLQFLATAHHANDNIETVLFNFFRGTGIKGLIGIKQKREEIIRPLLFAKREEILHYAQTEPFRKEFTFRKDSSNELVDFSRNAIRLKIIPDIQTFFPNAEENILNNIERLKEANILLDEIVALKKKKLIVLRGKEYFLPILLWKKTLAQKTLLWEYLSAFNFSAKQIPEIQKLFEAANGSHVQSASHRIFKNRNHLIVAQINTEKAEQIIIEENDNAIIFSGGKLKLNKEFFDGKIFKDSNIALLNEQEIKFPLFLRKWKQGDYFYPLGMRKKKKLSRFFIDNKLSLSQKENVWVLESAKKIIWVVGYRIDDRFKVNEQTKEVRKIVFIK